MLESKKGEGFGRDEKRHERREEEGPLTGYILLTLELFFFFFFLRFHYSALRASILPMTSIYWSMQGKLPPEDLDGGSSVVLRGSNHPIQAAQVPCSALTRPAKNFGYRTPWSTEPLILALDLQLLT